MKFLLKNSWMIVMLFSLVACAQKETLLKPDAFENAIQKNNTQILDVRTAEEFASGYIENAMLADWNDQKEFQRRVAALNKKQTVAVYCLSGGRSSKAVQYLKSQGFDVVELEGGINAWNRADKKVANAGNAPEMSWEDFKTQINIEGFVLVDVGAKWCPPCRQMEPVVSEFIGKNANVKFLMLDGGKDKTITKSLAVDVMPTFILYKNGVKVWSQSGIVAMEEFEKAIQ